MTDYVDRFFNRIGINGSDSKAMQFVVGMAIVTVALIKYSQELAAFSIIGVLFGAYFMLKAIK